MRGGETSSRHRPGILKIGMCCPLQIVRLGLELVDDVERVAQCLVETSASEFVEVADGLVVECIERDRDDVVATDDARFGQAVFCTEFDFGSDSTDGACDWRTGHRGQDRNGGISGQHAHRPATCRRTEVSPEDVVASYHAGVV
jgi:hypothetical protein